jgi:hypothetical protein
MSSVADPCAADFFGNKLRFRRAACQWVLSPSGEPFSPARVRTGYALTELLPLVCSSFSPLKGYVTVAKNQVHFWEPTLCSLSSMGQKKQINARVSDHLHEIISERAGLIEETQGGYLGLIAQWWFAQGYPPVNEYEARVLAQKKNKLSEKRIA